MNDHQLSASSDVSGPTPMLLRLPAVMKVTGLCRSTLYRMVAEHTFPEPVRLAKRAVAWRRDEVIGWTSALPRASDFPPRRD